MSLNSKLRRVWYQVKQSPFLAPEAAGCAVLTAFLPWVGISTWYGLLLLWAALWAVLEQTVKKGWPRSSVRFLTPNFYAVKDLAGVWRIFQRSAERWRSCSQIVKGLLKDQKRLPDALPPGRYYALTHETILLRLQAMCNVKIISCREAYVATMEETVFRIVRGRCRHCIKEHCPFLGRSKSRMFYEIRFEIKNAV